MAQGKKKGQDEPPGAPAWMVTYGDLMSLLLTFFVLLLSFSSVNQEAFNEALQSLRGALGVLRMHESPVMPYRADKKVPRTPRAIERLARELMRRMQILGMDEQIDVEFDNEEGGLKISLPSRVLFDTAKADLKPEAYDVLGDVADVLGEIPEAFIEVRGHTDSRPLRSSPRFADNWDLSYHRAKAVTFHLQTLGAAPQSQFEAIACGPSQPIASNDTEEGMQANRRVELFVRGDFPEEAKEQFKERIEELMPPAQGVGGEDAGTAR